MRALRLLPLAACIAALSACADSTEPTPATPLLPGRYDATFQGGLGGTGEGTAKTFDVSHGGPPRFWMELRDERVPAANTLVRFIVRSAALTVGTHAVGGSAAENPVDAVALQFPNGAATAERSWVGFTGTVRVEEVWPDGEMVGSFDVRSGSLRAKGRFDALPSPY